ncbi:hypothetical protein MRX96_051102 [Rhipicephalus microplus]
MLRRVKAPVDAPQQRRPRSYARTATILLLQEGHGDQKETLGGSAGIHQPRVGERVGDQRPPGGELGQFNSCAMEIAKPRSYMQRRIRKKGDQLPRMTSRQTGAVHEMT